MPLVIQRIFSLFILLFLMGCESFDKTPQPDMSFKPHSAIFSAEYSKAWRAVQVALSKYPIMVNNLDSGVIKTGSVEEYKIWKPAHKSARNTGGYRYTLNIKVSKGKVQKKPVVRISILKKATRKDDFFAKPKPIMSSGLEEQSLLYRIKRELIIEKALERAAKDSQ